MPIKFHWILQHCPFWNANSNSCCDLALENNDWDKDIFSFLTATQQNNDRDNYFFLNSTGTEFLGIFSTGKGNIGSIFHRDGHRAIWHRSCETGCYMCWSTKALHWIRHDIYHSLYINYLNHLCCDLRCIGLLWIYWTDMFVIWINMCKI